MRISLFGLGYVGTVTAACLAQEGHSVIGADISEEKVEQIRIGKSPIVEEKIGDIIASTIARGLLSATTSANEAIDSSDISMICVGTPSKENGDVDLSHVLRVSEQLGRQLATKKTHHTLIYRSTVPPGTTEEAIIPTLEKSSGKKAHVDFDVCFNPEFLREASSVDDFYNPPFTVVGCSLDRPAETARSIYSFLKAPFRTTTVRTAEMLKYVCNTWHALKVCFGNEIGTLAHRLGIDGHEVMQLFMLDTKQNLSGMYLKPGFAYGGSCLPKDVQGLLYLAKKLDFGAPLLASIPVSNEYHLREGFSLVTSFKKKKIGFLGLAFKGGTDDLRESPLVRLAEMLIGKGYNLRIYDKNVNIARIVGSNKSYIEKEIPHIEQLFASSVESVVNHAEVVIVGNSDPEYFQAIRLAKHLEIVDFVRSPDLPAEMGEHYHGICW